MSIGIDLLLSFGRVGTLAWGGGAAQVPLMKAEVVERHAWMSETEFLDALATGYALPGPIAGKMAVYVGYQEAGLLGAAACLTGIILPSALMIGVVVALLSNFKEHPRVVGMLAALRPAVLGLLVWMVLEAMMVQQCFGGLLWRPCMRRAGKRKILLARIRERFGRQ